MGRNNGSYVTLENTIAAARRRLGELWTILARSSQQRDKP